METTWWDHEHALLGEALSVFADWQPDGDGDDHDDSSSTTTSSSERSERTASTSTPPSAAAVHGPRRPVKINRSRERQKQEMLQLQGCVVELEDELTRLRMKREKRSRPDALLDVAASSRPSSASALVAWEKATRRQFRARKKAEIVNLRLREMLRTQASVADDLIRVIQRAEAARQEAYGTALFPVSDPVFTLSHAASDQELHHRLMKLSTQWHVPFASCAKFHAHADRPREHYFFETTVIRDDAIESVLEIRASSVFPFDRRRFEDELWQYFVTLRCNEEDFSLATDSFEASDTLLGSLRATVAKDGVLGVLDARFMKQQFRNEHGELIITSTTCGRPGLKGTRGLLLDQQLAQVDAIVSEDSWLRVLDAVDAGSSASSTPMTCIQNVRRSRIQFRGTDRPDRQQIEGVKKFLSRLAENEMRWGSEVVERRLMLGPCNLLPLAAA